MLAIASELAVYKEISEFNHRVKDAVCNLLNGREVMVA